MSLSAYLSSTPFGCPDPFLLSLSLSLNPSLLSFLLVSIDPFVVPLLFFCCSLLVYWYKGARGTLLKHCFNVVVIVVVIVVILTFAACELSPLNGYFRKTRPPRLREMTP